VNMHALVQNAVDATA